MITRAMRLQLIAFLLVTVVGVGYTGFRYAGFGDLFGASTYPVLLQLEKSGGIFTGADVTYRGVSVGRVGPISLTDTGIEVQLDIRRDAPPIPADLDAAVRNLSPIGEQHVDLQPASDGGQVLAAGSVIPADRTTTPVPVEELVVSVDDFVQSVPLDSLRTTVSELGAAFDNTGEPLQQLLDTTHEFTGDALDHLPETTTLIEDGHTVLRTQNETAGSFRAFSADLKSVAAQLKESDPDLRRLLRDAPPAAKEVRTLLRKSGNEMGLLIADLVTISRIAEPRQAGLRQVLAQLPGISSNGYSVAPGDGTAHLGLVVNLWDPWPCTQGYETTDRRPGTDTKERPVNHKAYCAEPPGSPINVRGAQNVPEAYTPKAPADAKPGGPPNTAGSAGDGALPDLVATAPGSLPPLSSLTQILG